MKTVQFHKGQLILIWLIDIYTGCNFFYGAVCLLAIKSAYVSLSKVLTTASISTFTFVIQHLQRKVIDESSNLPVFFLAEQLHIWRFSHFRGPLPIFLCERISFKFICHLFPYSSVFFFQTVSGSGVSQVAVFHWSILWILMKARIWLVFTW